MFVSDEFCLINWIIRLIRRSELMFNPLFEKYLEQIFLLCFLTWKVSWTNCCSTSTDSLAKSCTENAKELLSLICQRSVSHSCSIQITTPWFFRKKKQILTFLLLQSRNTGWFWVNNHLNTAFFIYLFIFTTHLLQWRHFWNS